MFKKMLSMFLVVLLLSSVSVTLVSAEVTSDATSSTFDEVATDGEFSTGDEVSSFDEAYAYLISVIEATEDVNGNYYTEESYEAYLTARYDAGMAHINAGEDMYTAEDFIYYADELLKAREALEYLIFGDTNGNTVVNIKDATEIQKHLAGIVTLSEKRLLCADIDSDGVNNIKDATFLQKFLAGMLRPFEIPYIELDFHIIDLKFELKELIEYGTNLTVGNKFEEESYYRYLDAESQALSAYSSKWPFEEDSLDVTSAFAELELAIEGLIPADEIPKVPDTESVKFKAEYEYRIYNYSFEGENTNFLIDNLQDLKSIVSEAGEDYDYNNEISIPQRYNNEEFFEENSIIVSLFVVGGSGCEQEFDALTVEGTNLTIHRTVTRPRFYPPDIDYRFTLIEVPKADIEGVTQIVNDTDYVMIAERDY